MPPARQHDAPHSNAEQPKHLPVGRLPLAHLLGAAVRTAVQPAVGVNRHGAAAVLAHVHGLRDVAQRGKQAGDTHLGV